MNSHRKRTWRLVVAGMSLMLILGGLFSVPSTYAATAAATSSVDILTVAAGGTITVQVSGLEADEQVLSR